MIIFDTYFVAIAMFELGLFNEDDKSIKLAEVFNVHCDFCSTHFRYGMIVSANEDIHWQGFDQKDGILYRNNEDFVGYFENNVYSELKEFITKEYNL